MGQSEQVLAEVYRLRDHMNTLPAVSDELDQTAPWDVREMLLDTGFEAARRLGRSEEALEMGSASVASMSGRGAPETEIARSRFYHYGTLIELGRLDEAIALLAECREVFEQARDISMLGPVLGALADAEHQRGHGDIAAGRCRAHCVVTATLRDTWTISGSATKIWGTPSTGLVIRAERSRITSHPP